MMVFGRRSEPPTLDSSPAVAPAPPEPAQWEVRIQAHDIETSGRIGKGSQVRGTLHFEGGVSVHGEVEGEIFAGEAVIVRRGGHVTATIRAKEVIVEGDVQARVYAERLEIGATGRLSGDVVVRQLVIHEGAVFEGGCRMGDESAQTEAAVGAFGVLGGSYCGGTSPRLSHPPSLATVSIAADGLRLGAARPG